MEIESISNDQNTIVVDGQIYVAEKGYCIKCDFHNNFSGICSKLKCQSDERKDITDVIFKKI